MGPCSEPANTRSRLPFVTRGAEYSDSPENVGIGIGIGTTPRYEYIDGTCEDIGRCFPDELRHIAYHPNKSLCGLRRRVVARSIGMSEVRETLLNGNMTQVRRTMDEVTVVGEWSFSMKCGFTLC